MALLEWKDRYSVGNAAVDHEHRELIDQINVLHAALRSGEGRARVEAFFGDLYRSIASHFALEERLMREHGYAGYDGHKQDHERLLDDIRDMMEEGEASEAELSRRLDTWFSVHFAGHDSALHKVLGPPHRD